MKRTFTKYPVTASQETGTVQTYRNRRNPNKHIEVKKGNDGHSYARQYMEWDTPEGKVKNYTGAKDAKRGRYFRHRRDTIDQMLEDYDKVECSDDYLSLKYTFYFGDGNSAASRGTEPETDSVLSGLVSWDELASAAVVVLNKLPNNFIDADILDALYDAGYSVDEIDELQARSLDDAIASLDVSGGDVLIYKVEKNGEVIYQDDEMEELVNGGSLDDDYDDDEDDDEYYDSVNSSTVTSSESLVVSGFSFDFIHDGSYSEEAIEDAIEDIFDRLLLGLLGVSFESVDYSDYPEYADEHISQCQVTFDPEDSNYPSEEIIKMTEQRLELLGYEVIGSDFYSI